MERHRLSCTHARWALSWKVSVLQDKEPFKPYTTDEYFRNRLSGPPIYIQFPSICRFHFIGVRVDTLDRTKDIEKQEASLVFIWVTFWERFFLLTCICKSNWSPFFNRGNPLLLVLYMTCFRFDIFKVHSNFCKYRSWKCPCIHRIVLLNFLVGPVTWIVLLFIVLLRYKKFKSVLEFSREHIGSIDDSSMSSAESRPVP